MKKLLIGIHLTVFCLLIGIQTNAETPPPRVTTTLGDTIYGGTGGKQTRLPGNTTATKLFLTQTGNGAVSAAPGWNAIIAGDVPTLNQSTSGNAATATALAANPSACSANRYVTDTAANGDLTCAQVDLLNGVTGTFTSGGIPYFSSTSAIASSGALTASQLVLGGGAGATPTSLAAGTQYQVLRMGASNPAYGSINLDQSAAVTGTLPNGNTTAASANTASAIVARDGSGNFTAGTVTAALTGTASGNLTATPSNHGMLISGSGNTVTVLAPDASTTKVWTSGGSSADPSWQTPFTYTANQYGVALSSATNATVTILAPNASVAFPLVSGGTGANPSWAGLTVAGGGTGLTAGTSGGVPYYSSTSAMTSSALLAAGKIVIGGGAGTAPLTDAAFGYSTSGDYVSSINGNTTNVSALFGTVYNAVSTRGMSGATDPNGSGVAIANYYCPNGDCPTGTNTKPSAWFGFIARGATGQGGMVDIATKQANDNTTEPTVKLAFSQSGHPIWGPADAATTVTAGAGDCGTSPSIKGNDVVGRVTVGSSTNGGICTVTFGGTLWGETSIAAVCHCTNETAHTLCSAVGATTTVKLYGVFTAADVLTYSCAGYKDASFI